ncbi:MAG: hypothetical protein Q7V09_19100, partial [Hydrogenophaga sp.]|uniref:hypothetical protein n=1 Tax=Hydrogenophaga sp. TaxID=1904254 RepID=UPI002726D71F
GNPVQFRRLSQGLFTLLFQNALRIKKAMRKARNAAGVAPPARLRNAAHGLFGRNPKGMGWKKRHSSLHS